MNFNCFSFGFEPLSTEKYTHFQRWWGRFRSVRWNIEPLAVPDTMTWYHKQASFMYLNLDYYSHFVLLSKSIVYFCFKDMRTTFISVPESFPRKCFIFLWSNSHKSVPDSYPPAPLLYNQTQKKIVFSFKKKSKMTKKHFPYSTLKLTNRLLVLHTKWE